MKESPSTFPPQLGQYELVRKLGEGAAGEVYLATHAILEQQFAIKVLRPEFEGNPHFTKRFFQEARLATRLTHPNITKVITADKEGDRYYLVMEFVPGLNLEEIISREGPLRPRRAIAYVEGILSGLGYAHQMGVLHRDVKAENVLIDSNDLPKLLDFGLIKELEDGARLTAHNSVVGTPYYMAPEQWRGDELDERADLFSVGVLLFFILSSRYPFPGKTPLEVAHRLSIKEHDPLGSLSGIPMGTPQLTLQKCISRSLARNRDRRYTSAQEFREDLRSLLRDLSPSSSAATAIDPSPSVSLLAPSVSSPANKSLQRNEAMHQGRLPNLVLDPVEIAPNTFWVGKRPEGDIFFANPYLRHFPAREAGQEDFNLIIDPGSSKDFSVIQAKVGKVIGNVSNISSVFINHQDPDVGSSVGMLLGRYTPNAHVLCSEDTWRLVHYYNIPRKRFVALEKFPRGIKLPTGDVVLPVPSPFCHFVGATMLYDPSTQVLFTGDLFGALTDKDAKGLYADESDWTGMRAFHQIYMPTGQALRYSIDKIRALDPPVKMIAPQHGRVLRGAFVEKYMEMLYHLPVGLDILDDRNASADELQAWTTVLSRILDVAQSELGSSAIELLEKDPNLSGIITCRDGVLEVTSLGKTSVERAVRLLCSHVPFETANAMKYEAVYAASELGLPTPSVELDEDGPDPGASSIEPVPEGFSVASFE